MDLDFTEEQDMLRDLVARHLQRLLVAPRPSARSRTTRSATPPSSGSSSPTLDLIGLMLPTEYGGSGMTRARGRGRLRGVRPRAGADAALRERRDERRRAAARRAPTSRSRRGSRGSPPATRSSPPRGSSRGTASVPRACRRRRAASPTATTTTSSTARSGTSRSRARPTSSWCSPARRTASTCSSSTPRPPASR